MRLMWIILLAGLALCAVFAGWWLYNDSFKTTTLTVAAGKKGGDSYVLMTEVSEVLKRHNPRVKLDIRESRNSSVSISMINANQVDLAAIQSNTPAYTSVNLVADLFPDYFLLITRRDSDLMEISDLRNRRIAIPEDGSAGSLSFWSVIDHYKVPPESFASFSMQREKGAKAFLSGFMEAFFFVGSLRDPFLLSFIEEAGLRGIELKFISIDQASAMALKRPFLKPVTIVRGAFDGAMPLPDREVVTPSLNRMLVASSTADEEAIYELVKTVFENRLDLLIRMALSSAIQDPRQGASASLPLHPGAARFYDRDQPSFLQENAEPMALLVTILAMSISALVALRRNMSARAKNRADVYNDILLEVASRARDCDDVEELRQMRNELGSVLEKVVNALDRDAVTEDGFRSFSLLWGSVRDTVNDRIVDVS